MEKNCVIFVIENQDFFDFFDFVWTWILHLKSFLDYGLTWTEFQY